MSEEWPFAEEDAEENAPVIRDAANPSHQRRVKDTAKREADRVAAYWVSVFDDEVGRLAHWYILQNAGAFRLPFKFAGDVPDALQAYALAGEHNFGFDLFLQWLAVAPAGVLKMLQEHHPDLRPAPKLPRKRQ